MNSMIENVYVTSNNTVTICCSQCKRSKDVDVSRFKGHKDVRIKCPCGNSWRIQIEYRREYRKKTNLSGSYKVFPKDKSPGDAGIMTVVDLSFHGLRIKFKDLPFDLNVGDLLKVKFNLDDKNYSLVERDVVVKSIDLPYARATFRRASKEDSAIGFYLFQ